MSGAARLRELRAGDGLVVAPGAYDCLTARIVEQAGFPAVYMTGAGTAASLGYPDYGLLTMTEMAQNAARIAAAVDVPVIADADTGFGPPPRTAPTGRHPESVPVIPVEQIFARAGAGAWDDVRSRYDAG
jgi:2-methylisocitrate lyase-like PEP mutase family enzyme